MRKLNDWCEYTRVPEGNVPPVRPSTTPWAFETPMPYTLTFSPCRPYAFVAFAVAARRALVASLRTVLRNGEAIGGLVATHN